MLRRPNRSATRGFKAARACIENGVAALQQPAGDFAYRDVQDALLECLLPDEFTRVKDVEGLEQAPRFHPAADLVRRNVRSA